jgi:putative addiction module killer protein
MATVHETLEFTKWLAGIEDRARSRIVTRIRRITLGNFGDIEPIGEGVSELRIDHGPGYRVYLKRTGKEAFLLLCGGNKKTQSRDITKAKKLAADY